MTVLMPVYNGMAYLREAVDSVFAQTFDAFEFLIIDDASTDDSPAYLASLTDPRVRVERNVANLGQTGSLNRGLALARGEIIVRFDQDDVCLPGRIAAQVALHRSRPDVAVSCTWEYTIDHHGRRTREWRSSIANFGEFLGTLAVGKVPVWHPSVAFRASAVAGVGGYDPAVRLAEDYDLWLKLALARHGAAIVPEVLLLQRHHDARQSVTRAAEQRANLERSHQTRLVARFALGPAADLVGSVLRLDDRLAARRWTRADLAATARGLAQFVDGVSDEFRMTPEERRAFAGTIQRRLGPGLWWAGRATWLPSPLYRAVVLGLSPRLHPRLNRWSSSLHAGAHEAVGRWRGRKG